MRQSSFIKAQNQQLVAVKTLLLSCALSLICAGLVFVVFVLPAEFGRDPTGLGEMMGLKGMSGFDVQALSVEDKRPVADEVEFPLYPFESVEYKYELDAGQALVYQWSAESAVVFDLHSEEEGTDAEDAVSFSVGRAASQNGTYVAPFKGKHGWYWENRGDVDVLLKLRTVGFPAASITYSPQGEFRRVFSEAR